MILGHMRVVVFALTGLVAVAAIGGGLYYYFGPQSAPAEAAAQARGAGGPPPGMGQGGMSGAGRGGPPGMGRPTPVIVTKVATEVFDDHVEAIGTSSANESITVTAKVTGVIRTLNFDDGQYVEKGAEIAAINAGEQDGRLSAELANYDEQRKELDERSWTKQKEQPTEHLKFVDRVKRHKNIFQKANQFLSQATQ